MNDKVPPQGASLYDIFMRDAESHIESMGPLAGRTRAPDEHYTMIAAIKALYKGLNARCAEIELWKLYDELQFVKKLKAINQQY